MELLPSDADAQSSTPVPRGPADGTAVAAPAAPTGPQATITLVTEPDAMRVALAGEIDMSVRDELSDALEAAARPTLPVEVDCSGVTFIDSSGLSALFWLANVAPEPPRLVRVPQTMRDLLVLTGMEHAFAFGP